MSLTVATPLHAAYWFDCHAADPRDWHVTDPAYHGYDPDEEVPGARLMLALRTADDSVVELVMEMPDDYSYSSPSAVGFWGGTVYLNDESLRYLWQAAGHLLRTDNAEQAEVGCYDEAAFEWVDHGECPDVNRSLYLGRAVDGDEVVYLRLDLAETDGTEPTCWLDAAALHSLWEAAGYLLAGM